MVGGFGTVRVAKLDDRLVAVKELRVSGDPSNRSRFAVVRLRDLTTISNQLIILLFSEIRARAASLGTARSPEPPQTSRILSKSGLG